MISRVTCWEIFKHTDQDSDTASLVMRRRANKQMMMSSDRHMDRYWGRGRGLQPSVYSLAWTTL